MLNRFDSRKIESYYGIYEKELAPLRGSVTKILEIGIQGGGSLKMWKDYFPTAIVDGVDITDCREMQDDRGTIFCADQTDVKFLESLGEYDIIIDDGGHTMQQQMVSFNYLFPKTKKLYVIEDLHTSYWKSFGGSYKGDTTVEFLKNLIDVQNAPAISSPRFVGPRPNLSGPRVNAMHFYESIAFLYK